MCAEPQFAAEWINQLLKLPSNADWLLLETARQNSEKPDVEASGDRQWGCQDARSTRATPSSSRPGAFIAGLFDTSEREPRIPVLLHPRGVVDSGCIPTGYGAPAGVTSELGATDQPRRRDPFKVPSKNHPTPMQEYERR